MKRKKNLIIIFIPIIVSSLVRISAFADDKSNYKNILLEIEISMISKNEENITKGILKLKNLKLEMPISLLLDEIKDNKKYPPYRMLLADYSNYRMRYVKKEKFEESIPTFKKIIKNKNEPTNIRRNMISALTKGFILNELNQEREDAQSNIKPLLLDIIKDESEDPKVVAQAIHSLSRINCNSANDQLLNIVDNWEVEDSFKVKSASENLGRSKEERAIPVFINMINFTDDIDIFTTAVYSIGLTESPEMIEPILKNFDRFGLLGASTCRATLRKNAGLLKKIIANKIPGPIIPSVVAIGKINEESALPDLKSLLNSNVNEKDIIMKTIEQIESHQKEIQK